MHISQNVLLKIKREKLREGVRCHETKDLVHVLNIETGKCSFKILRSRDCCFHAKSDVVSMKSALHANAKLQQKADLVKSLH